MERPQGHRCRVCARAGLRDRRCSIGAVDPNTPHRAAGAAVGGGIAYPAVHLSVGTIETVSEAPSTTVSSGVAETFSAVWAAVVVRPSLTLQANMIVRSCAVAAAAATSVRGDPRAGVDDETVRFEQ